MNFKNEILVMILKLRLINTGDDKLDFACMESPCYFDNRFI